MADKRVVSRVAATAARRSGVVLMFFALLLPVILGFVAFSVDTGNIALAKARMQVAVDAAALAASQEIARSVEEAGNNGEDGDVDSEDLARAMAADVAQENGVFVNPQVDVIFGSRTYDAGTGEWTITWNVEPYNAVKVLARRDQEDVNLPDGKLQMAFAWALGQNSATVTAQAVAYVEARDIVSVLDFSGSMNDDSEFGAIGRLSKSTVETNMANIFTALKTGNNLGSLTAAPQWLTASKSSSGKTVTVKFRRTDADVTCTSTINQIRIVRSDGTTKDYTSVNSTSKTVSSGTSKYIDEVWVKSPYSSSSYIKVYDSVDSVKTAFGLNGSWPWSSGSWTDFVNHCRNDNAVKSNGYERMYGGYELADYLLGAKAQYSQCDDLWKTPHYPFHAMKQGMTLFCDFLEDLGFGDEVGLVSYATEARWEDQVSVAEDGAYVDVTADPITDNIAGINLIQRHKQAGHYSSTTAMGDGILKAREMLAAHRRYGARPVIFVMTDGNANVAPNGWNLPGGWNWSSLTDFDGDGNADYTTGDKNKQYALYQAKLAIDAGIVIHTLSVGSDADHTVMEAIAKASGGTFVKVDLGGDYSLETLESKVMEAYNKIAGKVPPPKLVVDADGL